MKVILHKYKRIHVIVNKTVTTKVMFVFIDNVCFLFKFSKFNVVKYCVPISNCNLHCTCIHFPYTGTMYKFLCLFGLQ